MNRPDTTRAWPWVVFVCALTAQLLTVALSAWQAKQGYQTTYEYWPESTAGTVSYAVVGLLICLRVPGNRLGPVMMALTVASGVQGLAGTTALIAANQGWPEQVIAWLGSLFVTGQLTTVFLAIVLLMLAPTGRPLNRFWSWVLALTCVDVAIGLTAAFLAGATPDSLSGFPVGASLLSPQAVRAATSVMGVAGSIAVLAVPLMMVCLVQRWVSARGDDRRRVTWVVIGGLAGPALIFCDVSLGGAGESNLRGSVVWGLAAMALPAGIAVAVLRHGLYGLDRVVSRTVTYAIVTGAVLAIYAATVALLSWIVPGGSSLAVAAATLAAAAAFQPVLHRVRQALDRRFNRAQYDGLRTVDQFGRDLRHVIHPEEVSNSLLDAVNSTLEPESTGLWLRIVP